ncbi:helix-hairpin-helix domain-containing protein [uncultured Parabacteroides sp.]|uniref:ComEA family DNA-binding protein n=1 Tax=uncultured Parabacteroides sp. TaxID=512312 RepID=UPI00262BEE1A|nr:helix-hairpin-helix domain-containing protein [uncultured Parabacteroides sp.]
MKWRDLFYFSKGERQALILFLSLIAMAWIMVIFTDTYRSRPQAISPAITGTEQDLPGIHSDKTSPDPIRKEDESFPNKTPIPSVRKSRRIRKESKPGLPIYPKTEKWPQGTIVELNSADTTALKKVPGIGSVFAKRIIKYRDLLGGFYSVEQLGEVYGIDEERYTAMKSWFSADLSAISQLFVNQLSAKELACHPYVSYKQAKIIEKTIRRKGKLRGWDDLSLLEEFPEHEQRRLRHYLSFR